MPPRDPRLCPALERAMPSDAVPGSAVVCSPPDRLEVLFGDGSWHPVSVRARRRDRCGREVVQIEFCAEGSTWGEAYLFNAERMREG